MENPSNPLWIQPKNMGFVKSLASHCKGTFLVSGWRLDQRSFCGVSPLTPLDVSVSLDFPLPHCLPLVGVDMRRRYFKLKLSCFFFCRFLYLSKPSAIIRGGLLTWSGQLILGRLLDHTMRLCIWFGMSLRGRTAQSDREPVWNPLPSIITDVRRNAKQGQEPLRWFGVVESSWKALYHRGND
jgi:hypothetical protein